MDGAASRWQALFDRMFTERSGEAAMQVEINDFGATPGVVRMRLEQGMELVARAAGK